ncbi:XRE family transcriptional regulator [[Clostridium] innocuum]|uniref:helix-turn-helix domain-containing protein n=1 Tax=Clostridium innocuum TaxID=1522 RepID=UPI000E50076D|nr:helix-turn-helix transcriptional regulator [[Clostridium] innocuum]RGT61145.1 XRE family transcriptional regulator [[Clostridium] innocuum]RJV84592.1 XRE family transcriptional regulator [Erysipelotrichaceae bacterium AF19-24AC]
MNERLKLLREALGLTQTDFGNKLGLARNTIANYEGGLREPNDAILKLICKTFNVDYYWLSEGADVDMFMAFPETIIDEVVEEFKLDKEDRALLETYLEASHEQRKALQNFFQTFAKKLQKDEE